MPNRRALLIALALPWVLPSLVLGQDAAKAFDSLYGADLKRVAATSDLKDDLELAGRMLSAARKVVSQPELLALMCDKAYELAARSPAGVATAVEAMELLGDNVPSALPACRQKLIALYQGLITRGRGEERQAAGEALVDLYADMADEKAEAGDWTGAVALARRALGAAETVKSPVKGDIQARVNELAARERLERQLADLKSRLKADPANRPAREQIIRLHLVDLDQPEEAARYVDATVVDESLRTYVPLAARGPEALAESVCLELGTWYRDLGDRGAPSAKAGMYERAAAFLEAYLARHAAQDISRTKAQLSLDAINALLSKLNAAADARGWADVLRLVDPAQHTSGGRWQRVEQGLSVTASQQLARATIPVLPDGSYDLQVKFTRASGDGPVAVLLPVASASCAVVVVGDGTSGLHMVEGKPYDRNATTTRPARTTGQRECTVDVKVLVRGKAVSVAANLDGQRCIRWEGAESDLSLGSWDTRAGPRALGLAAMDCSVTFTSARLRLLSGSASLLQVAGTAADDNTGARTDPRWAFPRPRTTRRLRPRR